MPKMLSWYTKVRHRSL